MTSSTTFKGNDRLLLGLVLALLTFWLFAASLGSAVGTAVSLSVFTAVSSTGAAWLTDLVTFQVRTDNVLVREGGMVTMGVNIILLLLAVSSVILTVPKTQAEVSR